MKTMLVHINLCYKVQLISSRTFEFILSQFYVLFYSSIFMVHFIWLVVLSFWHIKVIKLWDLLTNMSEWLLKCGLTVNSIKVSNKSFPGMKWAMKGSCLCASFMQTYHVCRTSSKDSLSVHSDVNVF